MSDETPVEVTSIYGRHHRRGLVCLKLGDKTVIMPPAQARELSTWLLEAATAADTDHVLVRFLMDKVNMKEEQAAQILCDFRSIRDELMKEST